MLRVVFLKRKKVFYIYMFIYMCALLSQHLHYVEHSWGRVGTSECVAFDQLFPPYFVEGEPDEMNDEALGKLIDESLRRLGNGAQAGMDVHEEYIPQERKKVYADGFED
jgi:hypothetical protein